MGTVKKAGGTQSFCGTTSEASDVADAFPRMLTLVEDLDLQGILVKFPLAGEKFISFQSEIGATDRTGTVDATSTIQDAIDDSPVGTELILRGTCRTTAMLTGRAGITLVIPQGATLKVDHTDYAIKIVAGFAVMGSGTIHHQQATSNGSLWLRPTALAHFSASNCPIVGDLYIRAYADNDPQGAALHWDMTDGSGSFAKVGNITVRGWDVAEGFTIPSAKYITSVSHGSVFALYCRAYIDSTTHVGQLAGFSYDAIHIQPLKPTTTQEFGIRLNNAGFFSIRDYLCWDWESVVPSDAIDEKIWLGTTCSNFVVVSPTTSSYHVVNLGQNNSIDFGAVSTLPPAILRKSMVHGSNDRPGFAGKQDDFLYAADRRYTVTLSGEVGGYLSKWMFDGQSNQFCRFTGDGTFKSVEIDLGSAIPIYVIGVACPTTTTPSEVKISVYSSGAWYEIYDSTNGSTLHVCHTKLYRSSISKIKVEALKSSNFDITEIFAYSPTQKGVSFLRSNGTVQLTEDLEFISSAAGKGLSMIDLTSSARKRVFLNNNVLQTTDGYIGYTTGRGGTVTQSTDKTTGVTLNTHCGDITLSSSVLNAGTTTSFVLTNNKIAYADQVIATHMEQGSLGSYLVTVAPGSGNATIYVRNISGSNLSEAIRIRFTVIKGATA